LTRTNTETYYGSEIIEGSFEVKLPTIWTDEKQRWKEKKKEDQGREAEDASARKGRKVMIHCVFHCFSNDLWLQRVEK